MARLPLDVADVFRRYGAAYRDTHVLTGGQRRVMQAIEACRTAALGGHLEHCDACGHERPAYNSCTNRHCPKCQALARARWLAARQAELLDTEYFHVVFTVPEAIAAIAFQNKTVVYGILFRTTAETIRTIAADPQHLGAALGFLAVLHTWGQTLEQHLHLHCVVPGGALARDRTTWRPAKPGFLFPVRALARVFRGKYLAGLQQAFAWGQLRFAGSVAPLAAAPAFAAFVAPCRATDWVVYAKPPFAGPVQVLEYLGRYTHRVAISNDRLVSLEAGQVRFRWRDYARGNRLKTMTLPADEFLRRFLLHVLSNGFVRIRHFGFLANRGRTAKLARCRALLAAGPSPGAAAPEPVATLMLRVTGMDITQCPVCRTGHLHVVSVFRPGHLPAPVLDTS